nr:uncharacterized protein LOC118681337 [Bactrocera oleae]
MDIILGDLGNGGFENTRNYTLGASDGLEDSKSTYKRSGLFVLVYTGNESERLTQLNVFTRFFELFVINVTFFLLMDTTAFAYTYFPFTPKHVIRPSRPSAIVSQQPRKVQTQKSPKIFPPKVRNLHGCELAIVTWHAPPFIIWIKIRIAVGSNRSKDGRALISLKSFEEIVKQNYTVNTAPILTDLLSSTLGGASIDFFDGDKNTMPQILKRIANGSKETLTIIEPALLYFNYQQTTEDERVAILPQKLIMSPLTMYMPKHSYLLWPINNIILYFIDVGIIDKFEKRYRSINQINESQEPVKLSLFLLLGIFSLYGALMILCILIFLLELWTVRSPLTKTLMDFLNY